MSPVVCILNNSATLTLNARFRLLRGDIDKAFQRLFMQTFVLRVVRPNGGAERELKEYVTGTLLSLSKTLGVQ